MKLKDWISAVVKWCCAKVKGKTTTQPTARQTYLLAVSVGSLAIAGNAAALTYTAHVPTNYTLTAQTGTFHTTGQDAGLGYRASHTLGAAKGSFAITGNPVSLRLSRRLRASVGSMAIGGQPATLRFGRKVHATVTPFTINGKDSILGYHPSSYPEWVASAGLTAEWDTITTSGATGGYTKSLPTDAPGAWSLQGVTYFANAPLTLNDLDAAGYNVFLNGGAYSFDNWHMRADNGGNYLINSGPSDYGSAATVALSHATMDAYNNFTRGGCTGGGFTVSYSKFINASETDLFLGGINVLTWCYFGPCGRNPLGDPVHPENIHVVAGTTSISHFRADSTGSNSGSAVFLHAESRAELGQTVTTNLSNGIVHGTKSLGGLGPIEATSRGGLAVVLNLTNMVIQKGSSTYVLVSLFDTGGSVTINATGCTDFDTGADIDAILVALSQP